MAVKRTKYYKKFVGTNPEPLDPHSPNERNEEDEKIRTDIINKFSGESFPQFFGKEIHCGFDGSQQYYFKFYEKDWGENKRNPEYTSIVEVCKTGDREEINRFPCDLENSLTDKNGPDYKKVE